MHDCVALVKSRFSSGTTVYDADRQTMTIDFGKIANDDSPALSLGYSAPKEVRNRSVIWLSSNGKESEYIGQNAFGAKRVIREYTGSSWGLIPANPMPARNDLKALAGMRGVLDLLRRPQTRHDVARRGHIKPQKVIAAGILLAAIFVFTLVALVRFIAPGN
jgi:hypothetical protein